MRTPRGTPRALVLVALGLAGLSLLTGLSGCVVVPTSGAVRDAQSSPSASPPPEATFVPRGPVAGQSATQTVDGFFAAMLASPMSATVARRFLTTDDASRWSPEGGYLTYAGRTVEGRAPRLHVRLTGVNRFDAQGAWLDSPPGGVLRLTLGVTRTAQGLRLSGVPDALLVDDDWFEQQTDPLSVYFFDPAARQLVAEPVFVPRGASRTTLLVHALLDGPAAPRVERTFVPAGTELNLSVTLRADGTAEVPLKGRLDGLSADSLERLAAQFAWTLRQVPEITRVQLLVGGRPLPVLGDQSVFDVTSGSNFDLAGLYPSDRLFGLRDGVVVRVQDDKVAPVAGVLGARDLGWRTLAVDVGADAVAGVAGDGRRLVVGAVGAGSPRTVLTGTDLQRPSWDATGRLWVLDRTASGAVVSVVSTASEVSGVSGVSGVEKDRVRVVTVRGISGRSVTALQVSADGTRLAAAVRRPGGDRVVVARIVAPTGRGGLPRATRAHPVALGGDGAAIRDLAWDSPTELAALVARTPSSVELDTASVDGSPVAFDASPDPETYDPDVTDLVGSGRVDEVSYVGVDGAGYVTTGAGGQAVPADVRALTYPG